MGQFAQQDVSQHFLQLYWPGQLPRPIRLARHLGDRVALTALDGSFCCPAGIGGLVMALFLNRVFIGRAFFRGLFLLPWVIPVVVVAVIWKWILNDLYGVAGDILLHLFPPWAHLAWFSDPMLALPTLIAINVWRGSPFTMVILLAGLQTVPSDQLEAARIDGASSHSAIPSCDSAPPAQNPVDRHAGLCLVQF